MNKIINNKKNKSFLLAMFLAANTSVSFATDIDSFFAAFPAVLEMFTKIFIGAILVVVFWGFVKFMFQDKKEEGKTILIWGILGIFVVFSVWAIVFFMQRTTFGKDNSKIPDPPAL